VTLTCCTRARAARRTGDWFNRIDWTGQHNNFGIGMPPASKNFHQWDFKRPILRDWQAYKPSPQLIARQAAYFKALLRARWVQEWRGGSRGHTGGGHTDGGARGAHTRSLMHAMLLPT
jgi:hypothetical protein